MITLKVGPAEFYDERTNEFTNVSECFVQLEHSLSSIAQWESKWKKSFLQTYEDKMMSVEEVLDYLDMMAMSYVADPNWKKALSQEQLKQIIVYISDSQTATTFTDYKEKKPFSKTTITAEIIYYWMTALQIPFACDAWHLSRLLTLIRVCSIKGQTGKKMPKRKIMEQNTKLNEERRRKYNTRG